MGLKSQKADLGTKQRSNICPEAHAKKSFWHFWPPYYLRSDIKQGHSQVCTPLLNRNTSLLWHCHHSAAHNNTLHTVCSHLHFPALFPSFTTSPKIHLNSHCCPFTTIYMQGLFLPVSQAPSFTALQTPQNTHSLQSLPLPARISKLTEPQFRSSVHLAGFDFLPKLPSPPTPDFFTHLWVISAVQYCSTISLSSVSSTSPTHIKLFSVFLSALIDTFILSPRRWLKCFWNCLFFMCFYPWSIQRAWYVWRDQSNGRLTELWFQCLKTSFR